MNINLFIFNINLIAFLTIIRREFLRIIRIWPQTILPPIITVILYFIVFGKIIGTRIGYMSGYQYIQYILPGLVMMSAITSSYANVSSSFFNAKFQKYIEELLIAPIFSSIVIIGFIFGGVIRSFVVCIFVSIFAYFFCDLYLYNVFFTFFVFILTALLFSLLGFINSLFAKKFDDISVLPTFILTPLIYFGGVFFSLDLLPIFLKKLIYFNPIFYIVNLFRFAFLGISEINIYFSLVILCCFLCFLYILCIYLFYIGYGIKK